MDQRWSFLAPWCALLKNRIYFAFGDCEEEIWDVPHRRLLVHVPERFEAAEKDGDSFYFNEDDEEEFIVKFHKFREALALLAAVAHVDQNAWKCLLCKYCQVENVEQEQGDIPARFVLCMDLERRESLEFEDTYDYDLVEFCGTHQREHPSHQYLKALNRIAAFDENLQVDQPGTDIQIPVHPFFSANCRSTKGSMSVLKDVWRGVQAVGNEWIKHRSKEVDVSNGSLRCTFVLEPILADFNDYWVRPEMPEALECCVANQIWFSRVSLWLCLEMNRRIEEHASWKTLGQLLSHVFESGRHCLPWGYHGELNPTTQPESPLQLGTVHLGCDSSLPKRGLEALGSAMALNQTARKVSVRLEMDPDDQINSAHWWKWLAYGIFSKRARGNSVLESLGLTSISSMSIPDMEAFTAVLASEHPEEDLFGCAHGEVDERDALLRGGVPIRWQFASDGSPVQRTVIIKSGARSVRAFSDDGNSEWVNVLIPGYGRCQAQRSDLFFGQQTRTKPTPRGLTSLKVAFDKNDFAICDGLPRFLAAVGPPLTSLTLDLSEVDIDESAIRLSCPNLQDLSLYGNLIELRLDFSEYQANKQPLPSLDCIWRNAAKLSKDMTDPNIPVIKCIRRLRVHLDSLWAGWDSMVGERFDPRIKTDLEALLQMLETNRSLEYLDVTVPSEYLTFVDRFQKHHLTPTNRALKFCLKNKIAFLSVLTARQKSEEMPKRKRTRGSACHLDQHVVSRIFSFAAPSVLRQVCLRKGDRGDWGCRQEAPL